MYDMTPLNRGSILLFYKSWKFLQISVEKFRCEEKEQILEISWKLLFVTPVTKHIINFIVVVAPVRVCVCVLGEDWKLERMWGSAVVSFCESSVALVFIEEVKTLFPDSMVSLLEWQLETFPSEQHHILFPFL